ncbi:Polypeptide N-acetylgalactosaminyltransferase 2 [Lamellibrachia satsuma]|nr:Polypeptide N-acetylgalactosaminyltransferase 2 [Lamellibrachia satsuma]
MTPWVTRRRERLHRVVRSSIRLPVAGTWTYEHGSGSTKTFWNWDCAVGFDHMSDNARAKIKDKTAAIVNPANIGTFAIDKTFFNDIGAYDEDMWGWGGENIDLSLRVWLFGGRIVKVPCSHMAHLEKKGYRDYRSKWYWDTMANFRRVVDLWGDNYTQTFFDFLPDVEKVGAQNLTKRLYLKKKAKHDISWYFKNVYPELLDTLPNVDSYAYGGARNKATDQCLDRSRNAFTVYPCHYLVGTQGFFLNTRGQLRHHSAVISVFVLRKGHRLWPDTFIRAYGRRDLPKWIHWKGGPIMDITHNVCLEARRLDTRSESGSKIEVTLEPCQFTNLYQQWTFRNYTTNYDFLVGDTYVARNGTAEYQMLKLYASYQSSTTSQRPTKGT